MHPCRHTDWIAQPMRNCYYFHCRDCTIIISHDMQADMWKVSRDPERVEVNDPAEQRYAYAALDQWMTGREAVYGHDIFSHPTLQVG